MNRLCSNLISSRSWNSSSIRFMATWETSMKDLNPSICRSSKLWALCCAAKTSAMKREFTILRIALWKPMKRYSGVKVHTAGRNSTSKWSNSCWEVWTITSWLNKLHLFWQWFKTWWLWFVRTDLIETTPSQSSISSKTESKYSKAKLSYSWVRSFNHSPLLVLWIWWQSSSSSSLSSSLLMKLRNT